MPEHGGQLRLYAERYQRPVNDWLDISTGINPNGWPVPTLPSSVWSRLPEHNDGLNQAASDYYQTQNLLAVPGTQAVIQLLPSLRSKSKVGIVSPAYAEHAYCWQQAGHELVTLSSDDVSASIDKLDVLIIINPNNPTGKKYTPEQLLNWQQSLTKRKGWLIVDEAFIDCTPEQSLAAISPQPGLIVLRSFGKFFGLAGLRLGFVLAETKLLSQLAERLGPWPIASSSRYIAIQALNDKSWQHQARTRLENSSKRLMKLLDQFGLKPNGGSTLFQWVKHPQARVLHERLAQQGILTRLFTSPSSLRFGLPADEQDWDRLQQSLKNLEGLTQ
jgi:cobalamin biosynthetic protein CobC